MTGAGNVFPVQFRKKVGILFSYHIHCRTFTLMYSILHIQTLQIICANLHSAAAILWNMAEISCKNFRPHYSIRQHICKETFNKIFEFIYIEVDFIIFTAYKHIYMFIYMYISTCLSICTYLHVYLYVHISTVHKQLKG